MDLYPNFLDKAAVLLVRPTKNHPLPDGNKRAAWVSMRMFVAVNDWTWGTKPSVDEAEATVVAIASGDIDETGTTLWLSRFLISDDER